MNTEYRLIVTKFSMTGKHFIKVAHEKSYQQFRRRAYYELGKEDTKSVLVIEKSSGKPLYYRKK